MALTCPAGLVGTRSSLHARCTASLATSSPCRPLPSLTASPASPAPPHAPCITAAAQRRPGGSGAAPTGPSQPPAARPPAVGPGPGSAAPPAPLGPGLQAAMQKSVAYDEGAYVEVGRVCGAFGVRGEVKVESSSDEPDKRFKSGARLFLRAPVGTGIVAGQQQRNLVPVTSRGAKVKPLGKGQEAWMVTLAEVASRTEAEALQNYQLYVAVADRGPLRDPDEFYAQDLIGCRVVDQATGVLVGEVVDVYSGMGTHDTLRVKLRANEDDIRNSRLRYCMVPFAKAICPVVDARAKTLQVAPPEGLLDLWTTQPLKKPLSDEAKEQKLRELREALSREQQQLTARGQQQQQGSQATAVAEGQGSGAASEGKAADKEGTGADSDEDAEDEEGEEQARPAPRVRRPGLRRGAGGARLRLGRRKE